MERKHKQDRWERKLNKQVINLEEEGHPVHFVTPKVLHDYGGMNYEAAKEMGFPWPKGFSKKGYLISATSCPRTQCKDLHHEHMEFTLMTDKGLEYWPAHLKALKAERDIK